MSKGVLHSMKNSLFHGEKHVDVDYDVTHQKFVTLIATMQKLKQNANAYISSVYSVFLNSNNLSIDFATMLDDAASTVPNEYQTLSQDFRAIHNRLNSEKQQLIAAELNEKVVLPIDQALREYAALQTRITKRDELHTDLEYYLNKVHSLGKERDERIAKGKTESSSHVEKFHRNEAKLNESRTKYTEFTSTLMADLMNAWNGRIAILGPALASFVQAEKLFLSIMGAEINNLQSSKLTEVPTNVQSTILERRVSKTDIPKPVIAGDLQAMKTYRAVDSSALVDSPGLKSQRTPSPETSTTGSTPIATKLPTAVSAPVSSEVKASVEDVSRSDSEGMGRPIPPLSEEERRVNEQNAANAAASMSAISTAAAGPNVAGGDGAFKTHSVTTSTCADTATAGGVAQAPSVAVPFAGTKSSAVGQVERNPFEDDGFSSSPPPPPPAAPKTDLVQTETLSLNPTPIISSQAASTTVTSGSDFSSLHKRLAGEDEKRQAFEQDRKTSSFA